MCSLCERRRWKMDLIACEINKYLQVEKKRYLSLNLDSFVAHTLLFEIEFVQLLLINIFNSLAAYKIFIFLEKFH